MLEGPFYHFMAIRSGRSDEVIGIAQFPRGKHVFIIYHSEMPTTGIMTYGITEAEYTSFREFGLFPVYKWVHRGTRSNQKDDIELYDPTVFDYFVPGSCVVRIELMP